MKISLTQTGTMLGSMDSIAERGERAVVRNRSLELAMEESNCIGKDYLSSNDDTHISFRVC